MRKTKFFSLLVCVVMILSLASTAFAWAVNPVSANPEVYVEVSDIDADGDAWVDIYVKADGEFKEETNIGTTKAPKYTGRGFYSVEIQFVLNSSYFESHILDVEGAYGGASKSFTDNPNSGNIVYLNAPTWVAEGEFKACTVWAHVDEDLLSEADRADEDKRAEMKKTLCSKTDLITFKNVVLALAEYPEDGVGATAKGEVYWQYYTQYASDGTSDYTISLKAGPGTGSTDVTGVTGANTTPAKYEDMYGHWVKWTVTIPASMTKNGVTATLINETEKAVEGATDYSLDTTIAASEFDAFGETGVELDVWANIKNSTSDTYSLAITAIEAAE